MSLATNFDQACIDGDLESVEYIIYNAIELAVTHGKLNVVEYFGDLGYDMTTFLHIACGNEDMPMVRYLLSVILQSGGELDDDIIYFPCAKGNMELLCLLLKSGAELWPESLNVAASGGHNDMIKFLIDQGVDVTYQEDEWNSLFFACQNGHVETVELLLDYGVPIVTDSKNRYCYDVTDKQEIKALFQEH